MLDAISPIDGRYREKVEELAEFFSEYALIKYRLFIEVRYFLALCRLPLPQLLDFPEEMHDELERVCNRFDLDQASEVKAIEARINHDVKAVEYYLKEVFERLGLERYKEFVHFGLTSQDINNTAIPLSFRHALEQVYYPFLAAMRDDLAALAGEWAEAPMLARTHGQPASPTRMGKEIMVFVARLDAQLPLMKIIPFTAKFGGATGNFNAHYATYPEVDWQAFAERFVGGDLGLIRAQPTTQIEHYDNLAAYFQAMKRVNTIAIDLCRDIWTYISMDYFKQKTIAGEVGSSAMPHKVNPIDFENAEGNLGLANALFGHLADKLPISRLQRDLTDSTVLRVIGVPLAHTIIAFKAIRKGLSKLLLNEGRLRADLEQNWVVVAEAIQSILRREGFPEPYEALKALTRGRDGITRADLHAFIDELALSDALKDEMKRITPFNYLGR
jgi:adenylosuccinate lyase